MKLKKTFQLNPQWLLEGFKSFEHEWLFPLHISIQSNPSFNSMLYYYSTKYSNDDENDHDDKQQKQASF